jgi:hypothetical protein
MKKILPMCALLLFVVLGTASCKNKKQKYTEPTVEKLKGTWDLQIIKHYQVTQGDTVYTHNTMYQPGGQTIKFNSDATYSIVYNIDGGASPESGTYTIDDWALTNDMHHSIFWNATSQYGAAYEFTEVKSIDENVLVLVYAGTSYNALMVGEATYIRIKN